jgi:hypothetical protein
LLSLVSISFGGTVQANAQGGNSGAPSQVIIPVSITYTYSHETRGCAPYYPCETTTTSTSFSGSANITPVEGGYEGTGSGSYEYVYDSAVDPYPGCPNDSSHTTTFGDADMVVHYQFSIDNDVTGGPDTSMYNSSWGVVEVQLEDYDLHSEGTSTICGETQSFSHDEGAVGFGCHFYSLDFTTGGSWTQIIDVTDDSTAKCVLSIGSSNDDMRIFGTVKGLIDTGPEGMPNSRVLLAKMDKEYYQRLSVSKPSFFKNTATSDNRSADYEFNFPRGAGGLPKMMVVSLLWYEGDPEFAVTNGNEVGGRFIPVYHALCVDDNDATKCAKWKETGDGRYEAEVNFEYGNEDQLVQTAEFMELEDWRGTNLQHTGGPISAGGAIISRSGTGVMMSDSAYIYYNSYRAMKYFETLGLRSPLNPLLIRSHDFDPGCPDAGAWYNEVDSGGTPESFGGLGTLADTTEATGGQVVLCDMEANSSWHHYEAPKLPIWHELGHYLQFQMYDADGVPRGDSHKGYANPGTNDSFIEGFAGFVAVLIDRYYGGQSPRVYLGQDLELELKIWGPEGTDEEVAVASILWDFHDGGREINLGYNLNGTSLPVSKVYQASMDDVSIDIPKIMVVIDSNEVKTLVDLYNAFVSTQISAVNLDMIYANHGVFADVVERNYVHDSAAEKIGESGSKSSPFRPVRTTPPPALPGSYIVSNVDATYNVTISFGPENQYYDYSYLQELKAGEKMYFTMPPSYYPSTATISHVSSQGHASPGEQIEIQSSEYWNYIRSDPPKEGVFKHLSSNGSGTVDSVTSVQYIQNVRNLLTRVSTEYKAGNVTGAETLVNIAYLDNFGHVEVELERRNATELKEHTAQMLRVELVELINDGADSQSVDEKIAAINANLDAAIVIVPEFPTALVLVAAIMIPTVISSRLFHRRHS